MYKVVLIDDEKWAIANVVHAMPFEEYGFAVAGTATTATQGMELIGQTMPDVVFVDIRMPVITGIEFIRELRPKYPGITFILISGYAQFDYAREGIQLGVFDYCLKPVTASAGAALLARLREHLAAGERERAAQGGEEAGAAQNAHTQNLIAYINRHLFEPLSLGELAKTHFLSANYCGKLIKEATGVTFVQYVREKRMKKACEYLAGTGKTVAEIAAQTGFTNVYHFAHTFTKEMGVSPRQYRAGAKRAKP